VLRLIYISANLGIHFHHRQLVSLQLPCRVAVCGHIFELARKWVDVVNIFGAWTIYRDQLLAPAARIKPYFRQPRCRLRELSSTQYQHFTSILTSTTPPNNTEDGTPEYTKARKGRTDLPPIHLRHNGQALQRRYEPKTARNA
jgi:hypothetical protein